MDLLERIFGVETMARARAAAREAQARANAAAPATRAVDVPTRRASSPAPVAPRAAGPPPLVPRGPSAPVFDDETLAAALPADFPTSILGTPDVARPPLVAAFASRDALLAAIVYAEALAPPVALR